MFSKGGPRGGAGSEKIRPSASGGGPNISLEEKSKSKSRKANLTSPVTPNAQSAVADIYIYIYMHIYLRIYECIFVYLGVYASAADLFFVPVYCF